MRDTRSDILYFWFEETQPAQWFQTNPDFDALIKSRYLNTYELARDGLCNIWAGDADGALALILLLDQFPRNMFRGTPAAYTTDEKALLTAKQAVHKGFDQVLLPLRRRFMYLPFEHSERLNDQRRAVELFEKMKKDDPLGYEYALKHLAVIEKFGRFPHRNKILGRDNTPEETEFLQNNDSGF